MRSFKKSSNRSSQIKLCRRVAQPHTAEQAVEYLGILAQSQNFRRFPRKISPQIFKRDRLNARSFGINSGSLGNFRHVKLVVNVEMDRKERSQMRFFRSEERR